MAETAQPVLIEHPEPGVAVLRLNRPQRSNAMDMTPWRCCTGPSTALAPTMRAGR